jgi:hypothetical protein
VINLEEILGINKLKAAQNDPAVVNDLHSLEMLERWFSDWSQQTTALAIATRIRLQYDMDEISARIVSSIQ